MDHSYSAALSGAGARPANLSTTTRTLDDITDLGVQCQPCHKLTTFVLGPIVRPQASERRGFDDRVHDRSIRLRRIYVKDVVDVGPRTVGADLQRVAHSSARHRIKPSNVSNILIILEFRACSTNAANPPLFARANAKSSPRRRLVGAGQRTLLANQKRLSRHESQTLSVIKF